MSDTRLLEILLGVLLLILGKRLFWLFVGIIGFISGMSLAPRLFPEQSQLIILAIAITLGLVGASLAVVSQWLAIIAAGFLGAGYLVFEFLPTASYATFFIAGIIGALLMVVVLDWALIVFSSLAGALLISQNLNISDNGRTFMFIALAVAGVVAQAAIFLGMPKE